MGSDIDLPGRCSPPRPSRSSGLLPPSAAGSTRAKDAPTGA